MSQCTALRSVSSHWTKCGEFDGSGRTRRRHCNCNRSGLGQRRWRTRRRRCVVGRRSKRNGRLVGWKDSESQIGFWRFRQRVRSLGVGDSSTLRDEWLARVDACGGEGSEAGWWREAAVDRHLSPCTSTIPTQPSATPVSASRAKRSRPSRWSGKRPERFRVNFIAPPRPPAFLVRAILSISAEVAETCFTRLLASKAC